MHAPTRIPMIFCGGNLKEIARKKVSLFDFFLGCFWQVLCWFKPHHDRNVFQDGVWFVFTVVFCQIVSPCGVCAYGVCAVWCLSLVGALDPVSTRGAAWSWRLRRHWQCGVAIAPSKKSCQKRCQIGVRARNPSCANTGEAKRDVLRLMTTW